MGIVTCRLCLVEIWPDLAAGEVRRILWFRDDKGVPPILRIGVASFNISSDELRHFRKSVEDGCGEKESSESRIG